MSIRGVTFDNQEVAAADHGLLFEAFSTDGILNGCAISFSGANITMAAGYLLIAGRLIQNTAAMTLAASGSGAYSRLVAVIDTTLPATTESFQQVSFRLDYAATPDGFAALTQDDINGGTGNTYEAALVVFAMSGANVSSIYAGPYMSSVMADYATEAGTAATATAATTATKLATARTLNVSDDTGAHTGTGVSFNGTSGGTIKLPSTIAANIDGSVTGNAGTATKLASARTIRTNLGSTTAVSFDGSANITPGVTGTLLPTNGGTGQTSLNASADALINALPVGSSAPSDGDYFIVQAHNGGETDTRYFRRTAASIWAYIKSKLTASDIPNLPASKITSGTFASERIADGAITTAKIAGSAVTNAKVGSDISAAKITGANSTLGAFTARRVYIGTAAPGSSVGSQGDLYIVY